MGRESEVVNVFGMKVIPSEVESVVRDFPGVTDVKVYAGEHRSGSQIVKAAVAPGNTRRGRPARALRGEPRRLQATRGHHSAGGLAPHSDRQDHQGPVALAIAGNASPFPTTEMHVNEARPRNKAQRDLARVIGEGGKGRVNPQQLDAQADFATLGVNSVDLMEFVLRAENEFGVDILSDMLPDELPTSLSGWARLISAPA